MIEDIGCNAAEMVFGCALRLPGEMIVSSATTGECDPSSYATRLRQHMRDIRPTPLKTTAKATYVPPDLSTCAFVFVRVDSVRKSLQPPYEGPFRVVSRKDKYFVIDRNGHKDTISIDRLKVAYVDQTLSNTEEPSQPSIPQSTEHTAAPSNQTPQCSRSGRPRKLPVRFAD